MAADDVLSRPEPGPDLVVRYDDHPDAVIDVFLPVARGDEVPPAAPALSVAVPGDETAPAPMARAPLVVFLHGGFWRAEWDRVHLRPAARALVSVGFVVATPEYRRGPGSWGAMSKDVAAALIAVRDLVDAARPGHLDPQAPLVLTGHSAGGQLALWSGLQAGPEVVERVVALAPVTDVVYAARTRMGDGAAQALLGGEPSEVPDAYDSASVLALRPRRVPVTLIQGDEDQQVPVQMNRQLAEDLVSGEGEAPFRYVELPGVDHFALIDPQSDAWPTVLRAITAPS